MESNVETTFSYVYYLQALKQGKFVIAPASVKIKIKYSGPIPSIEVISGSNVQQSTQAGETADKCQPAPASSDDLS